MGKPLAEATGDRGAVEMALRRMLWLGHGCQVEALYDGDDGEMRCNGCNVDFKRESPWAIEERWTDMALRTAARPAARASHDVAETG